MYALNNLLNKEHDKKFFLFKRIESNITEKPCLQLNYFFKALPASERGNAVDSDDETLDDVESNASSVATERSGSFRTAKCDSDYLSEIIGKVIAVLRQPDGANNYQEYLRLYQPQLSSYLREALVKYENRRLIACMEDILIDISDILYNELTFYAIMNSSNVLQPRSSKSEM